MTTPDACTCRPTVKIAALIRRAARDAMERLAADDIELGASEVFGSVFRCPDCGTDQVVSIVVTTLPRAVEK